MNRRTSFDVRFWKIRTRKGKRMTRHSVRWTVGGNDNEFHETYGTVGLAESRLSELRTAARKGEAFDMETGLPLSEAKRKSERTWYRHAVEYVDRRWDRMSGNSRKSVAETLANVTPVLLTTTRGRPDDDLLRRALKAWAFNKYRRSTEPMPDDVAAALGWVDKHSRPLADLADPGVMLDVLEAIGRLLNGRPAAANTYARKHAVLHNVLEHGIGRGLSVNPLPEADKKWTAPESTEVVDPAVVVNRKQADALIENVADYGRMGRHLVALFGCLYYAGLRPGEAVELDEDAVKDLPDKGWGTLWLRTSAPSVGEAWNDGHGRRQRRQLKHRSVKEVRPVPCPPPLTALLHAHIEEFGFATGGLLFRGERGGDLSESIYGRAWEYARSKTLTPAEVDSPLAKRPYDLRHACLSTWLNAGVDPTQVAEWAGNSVAVLLRVYAKCIAGRDEIARKRIEDALRQHK